jgi:hypothetical protein
MIKPTVLFLLVLGLSGYLYLDGLARHHYRLYRTNGYHTFFKATAYGLFLFSIASILNVFIQYVGSKLGIHWDFGSWVLTHSFAYIAEPSDVALVDIGILTILLGLCFPRIYYICSAYKLRFYVYQIIKNFIRFRGLCQFLKGIVFKVEKRKESDLLNDFLSDVESPEFTRLIKESSRFSLPILFTMSDNKVFIGYLYEFTGGNSINDILILPLQSGYRCSKTKRFHIVTRYADVIQDIKNVELQEFRRSLIEEQQLSEEECDKIIYYSNLTSDQVEPEELEPYLVALPYREIVHAHLHNINMYTIFQEQEEKDEKE